jgi:flagellar hook-associated protein 1 FlgK
VQWTYHVGGAANQLSYNSTTYAVTVTGGVPSATPPIAATVPPPSGAPVTFTGGSASAFQNVLTSTTAGVPFYSNLLDGVANSLISATNAAQASGYDLNGNAGAAMFTGTSASTIAIAPGFSNTNVAASKTGNGTPDLNGDNALTTATLGTVTGSADKLYQNLVGTIGQASKLATQAASTQDSVTSAVDKLRTAASGVSTDEEIGNLLTYQRSYQASSRVITTLDSMLDTLINRMGV